MTVSEQARPRRARKVRESSSNASHSGASARRARTIIWLGRILLPLAVAGIWELAVHLGWADPFFVSRPVDIIDFLRHEIVDASVWEDILITFQEALAGFAIGSALGIGLGFLLVRMPLLNGIVGPYLTAMNSMPRIALAPLFVLWFGLGQASKIALVVSLVTFILLGATMGAIGNVDPDLTRLSRVLGFTPKRAVFKVMIPWAVPGIFAGLQLGLVYAVLGAVAGEMIGGQAGIGQRLQLYAGTLNTSGVMGLLVLLALVSMLLSAFTESVRRRLMKYRDV